MLRAVGDSSLIAYDTTGSDDLLWGLGLGCKGIIHILLERVGPGQMGVLDLIAQALEGRRPAALCTLYNSHGLIEDAVGSRLLLRTDAMPTGAIRPQSLHDQVLRDVRKAIQSGRTETARFT